jgi:hypothetical protein
VFPIFILFDGKNDADVFIGRGLSLFFELFFDEVLKSGEGK